MAMMKPPELTFPCDMVVQISKEFILQSLRFADLLPLDRLSEHDRVIALRFDCWWLGKGPWFKGIQDRRELCLLQDVYLGKGIHTIAPDWTI